MPIRSERMSSQIQCPECHEWFPMGEHHECKPIDVKTADAARAFIGSKFPNLTQREVAAFVGAMRTLLTAHGDGDVSGGGPLLGNDIE